MKFLAVVHVVVAIGVGLLVLLLIQSRDGVPGSSGVIVEEIVAPAPIPEAPDKSEPLSFIDHSGEAVSEEDYYGKFLLVFFGYTNCPDVCPGNLSVMRAAMEELGQYGVRVQPIFVSFDPERDSPEVLANYVKHFHPRLIGLTGTPEQIAAAAKVYGVYYGPAEGEGVEDETSDELGLIGHTSETYLVGPNGEGLTVFRHDSDPGRMAYTILHYLQREDEIVSGSGS